MQLSVAVPLLVTVFVAASGYVATYLTNLRLARRQSQLERVNDQLAKLYGPLYAHAEACDRAWQSFSGMYGFVHVPSRTPAPDRIEWHGVLWDQRREATPEQAATWRLWMSTVFMPLNRSMVETVVAHADLLREDTIPEPLKALCAHVACYEPILARWQEQDFDSVAMEDHVSVAGNYPAEQLAFYLRESFEALKREQSGLLAQVRRER